jgi:kynurenine formamidase
MHFLISANEYIDTEQPLDLSMELRHKENNPRAWYVDYPKIEPVRANGFVGSVEEGGSVNFRDIFFNPHGHGTHTECYGHISREWVNVNQTLKTYWFKVRLISLQPNRVFNEKHQEEDLIFSLAQFQAIDMHGIQGLVIRSLPNTTEKKTKNYSATNPAYFEPEIADLLVQKGIQHFLVDLPSVDREVDGGVLAFHHRFWQYPQNPRKKATITEFIFAREEILDGMYMMNLQTAPFNNDATPSRPVLYKIFEKSVGQSDWTESHLDQF